MAESSPASIDLPTDLRRRLERAARQLRRDPNSLLVQAVQEYLDRVNRVLLADEARRQSILVSRAESDDDVREDNADRDGWGG